ncbi:MAG: Cellulose synthase operon protein YhjQ [Hydrocarboniphaga sp.]|uniref:cellulose biosynthesis protein BcsQ n=1 Tax=Hydrocarboniphaga sp. TaxID=2033016 RepID=UPI00260D0ABD|nr:cellulose biosynthesis protein BcsQ [Hydrocarboniphaga sp.]MDB5970704.1 Cellulose synthase operon protein YhjQ [Hydrocarboniphaga sp.]
MNPRSTLVAVVSPKGGVGKTSVVANLAMALVDRQRPVLAVDLDPQNALRLHLRMPVDDARGLAVQGLQQWTLAGAEFASPYGVRLLPYGSLAESDRRDFERGLDRDPDWLRRNLQQVPAEPGTITLIDTPPGGSLYLQQALLAADVALTVLLPDAASFVTIASMERWLAEYCRSRSEFASSYYLVNRMNAARPLCRDVLAAMQGELGYRLVPSVLRFDALVEEALASQAPVSRYAPDSIAAQDAGQIADWLLNQPEFR